MFQKRRNKLIFEKRHLKYTSCVGIVIDMYRYKYIKCKNEIRRIIYEQPQNTYLQNIEEYNVGVSATEVKKTRIDKYRYV